jgi:hypothetical protein
MTHGPRPLAAARAEAELIRDPWRSNAIVAISAATSSQHVGRARTRLERTGVIEAIPVTQRAQRPRTWPLTLPRKAIEALGPSATAAEVMALSGCSYQAAWRALSRARRFVDQSTNPADAAAATSSISVDKSRPFTSHHIRAERPMNGYYQPADAIELACFACTAEWREGRWQHERSCVARRSPAGR